MFFHTSDAFIACLLCKTLRVPFTETKRVSPTPEKHSLTITPPSTKLHLSQCNQTNTIVPFYWQLPNSNPSPRPPLTLPSDCQTEKRDLSSQRSHLHCSSGGLFYTIASNTLLCASCNLCFIGLQSCCEFICPAVFLY